MRRPSSTRLHRSLLIGSIQLLAVAAIAATSVFALADSPTDPAVASPSGTTELDMAARPRPTPTPTPQLPPSAPYAYKTCTGMTNPDGTVSQGQSATCTVAANTGSRLYKAGEEVDIFAGADTGIVVTGCSGVTTSSYSTSGTLVNASSGAYCAFQVQSGVVAFGQSLGTETFVVPGTVASGTQIHQSSRFCTAPGADGERACTAQFAQMPVSGPAS